MLAGITPDCHRRPGPEYNRAWTKVYLVFAPNNVAKQGEANRNIISAMLTRAAAQAVVDKFPGSYIERVFATK